MRYALLPLLLFAFPVGLMASPKMTVDEGAVNGVLLEHEGHRLAVYGWKASDTKHVEHVLLAHGRRDVVWKAEQLALAGVNVIAPNRERFALEKPDTFWQSYKTTRFHDYAQQSTKILAKPLTVGRWVSDGDTIDWHGLKLHVIETPGYTRGSVSYLAQVDDQEVAFTGDLIYGDGQILDLYSFQDAIPDAQIRGYHGYGSRLAQLVSSLQKISTAKPDIIVPARGPVIRDPQAAIARLTDRVQKLYRNYLSTNALHWYFKEDRMRTCGERVLGKGAEIELMPYSHHEQTPSWVFEQGTSRLLVSKSGKGFLLDCGSARVLDAIDELLDKSVISAVEGIFVTHYHDDHTNFVQAAAEKYMCPVYATKEYADVLERPHAYHLPAVTDKPIKNVKVLADNHVMQWHEFTFTFYFFPGQTYFHGALLAKKPDEKPIFFIGDAFAPSGVDDYCVRNRNLLHDDQGYLYCLNKLRSMKEPFWLVNEHIPFVFSFTNAELDYLETRYRERIAIMGDLFPWDDPNYGVDDRWATFKSHGTTVTAGKALQVTLAIENHSPTSRKFKCKFNSPPGWAWPNSVREVTIAPRQVEEVHVSLTAPQVVGDFLVTADIESEGMRFRRWAETLVTVE